MDLALTGKVAIVGGGSDGLGFAIADRLLSEGAFVTIFGRRAEKSAAAAEELSRRHGEGMVLGLAADCSQAEDINRVTASTVARFGEAVHVLVTNDGGPPIAPISALTDDIWVTTFERHFYYVVRSVRAALPYMTTEGGSILNVVSAVVQRPAVNMAAPVTVWSAVIGYAQTLALELGMHDISVNTLMAGLFDTQLVDKMLARQPELSKDQLGSKVPMGRVGDPREFANIAATLVSPNSRFITGTVVPVDGGSSIGAAFGPQGPPA
jgi:3-oxoacyl-[acyl-carrier protein] reductase